MRSSASLNSASAPRRELFLPSHLALRHHRGSLVISQRLLGTREVMLVHHTKCGLHGVDDAALRAIRRRTSSVRSTTSTMRCAQPSRACAAIRFSRTGTASVVSCTTSIPVACAKWWSSRPYAACIFEMARAMSLDFLIAIARVFVYVALLAWATTFVGLIPVLHSANGRRDLR